MREGATEVAAALRKFSDSLGQAENDCIQALLAVLRPAIDEMEEVCTDPSVTNLSEQVRGLFDVVSKALEPEREQLASDLHRLADKYDEAAGNL